MAFDVLSDLLGPVDWEGILRITIAALLGAGMGWERELHGRAAGLRTHMLLCIGCALIMLISLYLPTTFVGYTSEGIVRADPGRIAGHVLSGLGFLGAGAIIVLGRRIRGLTTAACVWVTAAIGLAVGCGYIVVAVFTFAVAMFALYELARWEARMQVKQRLSMLTLRFVGSGRRAEALREVLSDCGLHVHHCMVDWERQEQRYRLELHHPVPVDFEELTNRLTDEFVPDGLVSLKWG